MTQINPKDLKVGDIFYECSQYGSVKCEVTEPVTMKTVEFKDKTRKEYRWKAESISGDGIQEGVEIKYVLVEGLEHYGPQLYDSPAYVYPDELLT